MGDRTKPGPVKQWEKLLFSFTVTWMEPSGARWQRSFSKQNQTVSIWLLLETKKVIRPTAGRQGLWLGMLPLDCLRSPLQLVVGHAAGPVRASASTCLGHVRTDTRAVAWAVP